MIKEATSDDTSSVLVNMGSAFRVSDDEESDEEEEEEEADDEAEG